LPGSGAAALFPKVPAKICSNISGVSVVVVVLAVTGRRLLVLLSPEFLFFKTQNLNPLQASLLVPLLNEVVLVVRGGGGLLGLSLNLSKAEALSPPPCADDRKGCFGFEGFSGITLDLVGVGLGVTMMVSPKKKINCIIEKKNQINF